MATFHTPMITLSDGNLIPQIGLGVLRIDGAALRNEAERAAQSRLDDADTRLRKLEHPRERAVHVVGYLRG